MRTHRPKASQVATVPVSENRRGSGAVGARNGVVMSSRADSRGVTLVGELRPLELPHDEAPEVQSEASPATASPNYFFSNTIR
jgi:hypothetical protein